MHSSWVSRSTNINSATYDTGYNVYDTVEVYGVRERWSGKERCKELFEKHCNMYDASCNAGNTPDATPVRLCFVAC